MIYLKTEEEIELLRENNLLVSRTLAEVGRHIAPGVTTKELDTLAEDFIRSHGAVPAFLGYFFGVFFTFFISKIVRSISESGNKNSSVFSTFPPKTAIAFLPSSSSSAAFPDLYAAKYPPVFT